MSTVKTLAPIEILATREPLLFAKCGPMYAYFVCSKDKTATRAYRWRDKDRTFACSGCDFKSLVRLLSTSRAMREARKSCIFKIEIIGLWCSGVGVYDAALGYQGFSVSDNATMADIHACIVKLGNDYEQHPKSAECSRMFARIYGERYKRINEDLRMAVVCPLCCCRNTQWNYQTLFRSFPKIQCSGGVAAGVSCYWEVWFGTSDAITDEQVVALTCER